MLDAHLRGPLDDKVRDRVVAEARGNPLALLELPRGLNVDDLAGGYTVPAAEALSGRIEESFVRRLETLPEATQRLVLIAAAEPVGDPVLILRAAARLDVFREAAEPADAAGLLTFGVHVRFRHPLVRSAVYGAASQEDRQLVHRALGEATDPEEDPDRRAWHRAQAATGTDEAVAAELERSAGRARARGGYAAAAAFLERALELTLDPAHRARRALDAAQFKRLAGAPEAALQLLAMAQTGPLDAFQRARVDLVRGQIAFAVSHGRDAPPLLLSAARQLESLDDGLARETYRDALSAALYAGRAGDGGPLEVARAARAMPPVKTGARAIDLLLQGAALLFTDGPATAVPLLRRGLTAFRDATMPADERLRWIWLACRMAHNIWDADHWDALSAEFLRLARETGAASVLPDALGMRAGALLFAGELTAAWSLVLEEDSLNQAMGISGSSYPGVSVAAWQGREGEVRTRVEGVTAYAVKSGHGQWLTLVHWASSVLYNGLGRYDDALREAEKAVEIPREHAIATWAIEIPREYALASWALPELVESAMRTGRKGAAAPALERLARITRAGGADWGLGVEAMSRALMTDEEELYQEAIERLDRPPTSAFHARAELLYGEWLRRERRRLDARRHLSLAYDKFTAMGATGFADRAARELQATGATARKRTIESRDDLTPQEAQIARLAYEGLSNPEIAARLFISPRTVQYHLHKVFAKLDIGSRTELSRVLGARVHSA